MAKFVAIDFETANSSPISACAVGLVRVENNTIVRKKSLRIKPPTPHFTYTHVHGITWNGVRNEKTFKEHWKQISRFITGAEYLVAHNAAFDRRVLHACCSLYGLDIPDLEWKCTVKLSRSVLHIKPANLFNVCRQLFIPLDHHNALSDSEACAKIMIEVLERTGNENLKKDERREMGEERRVREKERA